MEKAAMMIKARKLVRDVSELPPIPVIVSRVISMLDSQESEPEEIADLLLSDPVLAARVIRLVNSPLYRPSSEITSVKRALLFLGFRSVRDLILTSYFTNAFREKEQAFDARAFWLHSFSVGAVSRRLATLAGYPDTERAYLVGIVHDIGKMFLGHYLREEYGRMLTDIAGTGQGTWQAEQQYLGTSHSEIGLCLAQRWNFPPAYCDIISHHHTPESAIEDQLLTAIICLADHVCMEHTASSIAQPSSHGATGEKAWLLLKQLAPALAMKDLESLAVLLETEFVEIDREVRTIFSTMVA